MADSILAPDLLDTDPICVVWIAISIGVEFDVR